MEIYSNILIDEDYCDNDYDNVCVLITKHDMDDFIKNCKTIFYEVLDRLDDEDLSTDEDKAREQVIDLLHKEKASETIINFILSETNVDDSIYDTINNIVDLGFASFVADTLYYCDELVEIVGENRIGY